jgi:hypothetical protein
VPNTETINQAEARAAAHRIRARAKKLGIGFNWTTLKAERDTGRP